MSISVLVLVAVWGAICLAVAIAGGLFRRPRRLASTRHLRRVKIEP